MYKLLTILLFSFSAHASVFYVSTSGTPSGTGSSGNPWNIKTAFAHPAALQPGDTVYVQSGTYAGSFVSYLTGTNGSPIVVKALGRVIIDNNRSAYAYKDSTALMVLGAYTWYIGFEITNTDPERIIQVSGSNPDARRGEGMDVQAPGCKIINFIIHDNGDGLGAWVPATNSEYYGNIIYNNGWDAPDRPHGHGIYTQNNTGTKTFYENVMLNNFVNGMQIYGSASAYLKNYYLQGNVMLNDLWLIGGGSVVRNIVMNNNFSYNAVTDFGGMSAGAGGDSMTFTNNFFTSAVSLSFWTNLTVTHNTVYNGPYYSPIQLYSYGATNFSTMRFDSNTYCYPSTTGLTDQSYYWQDNFNSTSGHYSLPYLRSIGQETHTTVDYMNQTGLSVTRLVGKRTFVRQNAYDVNRSHVIVYNWDSAATVKVSLAGALSSGDTYELHNVEDYYGDVITGTCTGDSLAVPMTGHTVVKPIGYATEIAPTTFPEFGTFVLIKTGTAGIPGGIIMKGRKVYLQ